MPRFVKALLIDPYQGTITEVDHDASDYQNIYALLSTEAKPVSTFEAYYAGGALPEGDAIFIDEEGRLKGPNTFFLFDGQPLAGRGLVLGSDEKGDTQACKLTFDECAKRVEFVAGEHEPPIPPVVIMALGGAADDTKPEGTADEQRMAAREALANMATKSTDDDFDEMAGVIGLGLAMETILKGVERGREIARGLGMDGRGVGAHSAIGHGGHEYHLTVTPCPNCEARAAEPAGAEQEG
jgi:hypothetical protein